MSWDGDFWKIHMKQGTLRFLIPIRIFLVVFVVFFFFGQWKRSSHPSRPGLFIPSGMDLSTSAEGIYLVLHEVVIMASPEAIPCDTMLIFLRTHPCLSMLLDL